MQVNLEFIYDLTPQAIDDMIAAMRAGTFSVAPMARSDAPEKTWSVKQDLEVSRGEKSAGARGVASPNNPGGLGDSSGVIMLDRFVLRDDAPAMRARSNERLVQDAKLVAEAIEE